MAEGKTDKGADFGKGTKNLPEQDYKQILKGTAPKAASSDGKPKITDKTS